MMRESVPGSRPFYFPNTPETGPFPPSCLWPGHHPLSPDDTAASSLTLLPPLPSPYNSQEECLKNCKSDHASLSSNLSVYPHSSWAESESLRLAHKAPAPRLLSAWHRLCAPCGPPFYSCLTRHTPLSPRGLVNSARSQGSRWVLPPPGCLP